MMRAIIINSTLLRSSLHFNSKQHSIAAHIVVSENGQKVASSELPVSDKRQPTRGNDELVAARPVGPDTRHPEIPRQPSLIPHKEIHRFAAAERRRRREHFFSEQVIGNDELALKVAHG